MLEVLFIFLFPLLFLFLFPSLFPLLVLVLAPPPRDYVLLKTDCIFPAEAASSSSNVDIVGPINSGSNGPFCRGSTWLYL